MKIKREAHDTYDAINAELWRNAFVLVNTFRRLLRTGHGDVECQGQIYRNTSDFLKDHSQELETALSMFAKVVHKILTPHFTFMP